MSLIAQRTAIVLLILLLGSFGFTLPEAINIQGRLSDPNGQPLEGNRAYILQFYSHPTEDNLLGASISGMTTVAPSGRFSFEIAPPPEILGEANVYYALGIDSANPSDGVVSSEDVFPERVKVNSVPFALEAEHAARADLAMGFEGSLSNPGDQIPLGNGVFLQVAEDGEIEIVADGRRLRLAGLKWFDPNDLRDCINPDGSSASLTDGDINNNGDAIVVWTQNDGSNAQVYRSEYRSGSWTHPASLGDRFSPPGHSVVGGPSVALNDQGEAVIAWIQSDGINDRVFRSEFRNGSWRDPIDLMDSVSPDGSDAFSSVTVGLANNGEAAITWDQLDGSGLLKVYRSEYRGGDWNDPTNILDHIAAGTSDAQSPTLAMNNNGDTIIVWREFLSSTSKLFRSEYRNGAWTDPSGESDAFSPGASGADTQQVAIDDNGDAVIVWRQSDGANNQIFRSEYRGGAWTDPSGLSDNISPDDEHAAAPRVALNNEGEALIVWSQMTPARSGGTESQIFRSEYRDGSWTDPADLSSHFSPNGTDAFIPRVALNDLGEAIIVWAQSDGDYDQIFRSEYRNGSWDDPANLSDNFSPNSTSAMRPRVGIANNSEAVIVWRQFDGAMSRVFLSEYRFGF